MRLVQIHTYSRCSVLMALGLGGACLPSPTCGPTSCFALGAFSMRSGIVPIASSSLADSYTRPRAPETKATHVYRLPLENKKTTHTHL